jgi:isopenicillin-N N-acyltransferase-like protein
MTPSPIPLVRVAGSHADVGRQVGEATAAAVRRAVDDLEFDAELVARYRAVVSEHVPWLVDEMDGIADGAGVERSGFFAASIEELRTGVVAPARCTDVLVTDGERIVVAHTNDESAGDEADVAAIEWRVPREPVVLSLGSGPWVSVGWNDAGLSMTGNELAPNDERVGIPRLLQAREVLTRTGVGDAIDAVLHPARASSYNWVFAHRDGDAVNVEASATAAEITGPGGDGALVHTNHYVCEAMRAYERPIDSRRSERRYARARELVADRGGDLRAILADHEGGICNHGDERGVKTVFWCIADVTAGEITYGRGNPCDSEPQTYRFGC